jgi:hypothetical protein
MKKISSMWKCGMVTLVGVAGVLGVMTLSGSPAIAGISPDCGPTRQWICETPGCPDCPIYLFEGTICEKNAYEKRTGRVCHLQ